MKTTPLLVIQRSESGTLRALLPVGVLLLFFLGVAAVTPVQAAPVPRRIVSLAPGLTECLFVLGAGDSVVGVTDYDRFPAEVRNLPSVGGYYDPSVEKILALSPDLVLGIPNFHAPLLDRLRSMGIPTAGFALHRHLGQVREALDGLGTILGLQDRASAIWGAIQEGLILERDTLNHLWKGTPPSILVIVWTDPMTVAGGVNYLDDILDSLGVPNAAGDISYTFPQVNREKVMAMDPDIVIVARASEGMVLHAEDFVAAFKGLPLRAIREAKVYELPADVLFHPGPRVLEAARLLGQLLTRERTGEDLAETKP